jgi:uncharacterized membrane protein
MVSRAPAFDHICMPTHRLGALRYGLPVLLIVAGFVLLFAAGAGIRWDGWAMCVGSGLSILFLSWLFRYGAKGDQERDAEQAARNYLSEHGHWPGEDPLRS